MTKQNEFDQDQDQTEAKQQIIEMENKTEEPEIKSTDVFSIGPPKKKPMSRRLRKKIGQYYLPGIWFGNPNDKQNVTFSIVCLVGCQVIYYFALSKNIEEHFSMAFSKLYFLVKAIITEPGVINTDLEEYKTNKEEISNQLNAPQDQQQIDIDTTENNTEKESMIKRKKVNHFFRENDINIDATFYKNRYCTTCEIYRPPLSSHCSYCGYCVKGFDHHCFFIGNCVGIRNMKYFIGFVFFGFFSATFWEICSIIKFRYELKAHPSDIISFSGYSGKIIIGALFFFCLQCCSRRKFAILGAFFLLVATILLRALVYIQIVNIVIPMSLIFACFFLIFMDVNTLGGMMVNIFLGVTLKEAHSISQQTRGRQELYQFDFKRGIKNVYNMITYQIPDSELSY